MKALILAAGMGKRLGALTSDRPKATIEVTNKNMIDRVLALLEHPAISEIAVVGGYHFDLLKGLLKGRDVRLFFNPDYEEGNILSLMAGLDFIDDDLLLMNVDHIYPKPLFEHVIKNVRGISAVCDFDRRLVGDDMKVELTAAKKLGKISKQLSHFDCGYIGMTYCGKEMTSVYKKAVKESLDAHGRLSCVEYVLGLLAQKGVDVNICDASGFGWLEIDTPEDLKAAEAKLLRM